MYGNCYDWYGDPDDKGPRHGHEGSDPIGILAFFIIFPLVAIIGNYTIETGIERERDLRDQVAYRADHNKDGFVSNDEERQVYRKLGFSIADKPVSPYFLDLTEADLRRYLSSSENLDR